MERLSQREFGSDTVWMQRGYGRRENLDCLASCLFGVSEVVSPRERHRQLTQDICNVGVWFLKYGLVQLQALLEIVLSSRDSALVQLYAASVSEQLCIGCRTEEVVTP